MTEREELASRLWQSVQSIAGLSELVGLLDTINAYRQQDNLEKSDHLHLLRAGLGAIRTITFDDPATAVVIIRERLVPLVLQVAPDGDHDTQIELSNLRKLLANWIDAIPDQMREELRQHVLAELMAALKGDSLRAACWAIAEIGFRDQQVVDKLWAIVETNGEQRNTALSAIVNLGVSDDTRERILKVIEPDIRDGIPPKLRYVLQELAAPETAEYVLRFIETLRNEKKGVSIDVSLAQSLLKRITDSSWDDQEFQAKVWAWLSRIADEENCGGRTEFDLRSEIGRDCNRPEVIPHFLNTLADVVQGVDGKERAPWLPLMRLNECFRPLHMEGWRMVGNCTRIIDALGQLARRDTGHDIGAVTVESRAKSDVWNHLLSLGSQHAFECCEEAIANERSPYVQSDVLECAACLAFSNLPRSVVRLVTEDFDAKRQGDARQFVARLAAAELARSAATFDSFNILLGFGLTHEGSILLSSLRAIQDVAVALVKAGNKEIPSMLCSMALDAAAERRREAAIAGLHALAMAGQLGDEAVMPLMDVVQNNSLPSYTRDEALEAIGFLPKGMINDEQLAFILQLARGGSQDSESSRWRAIEILIRHEFLPGTEYDRLLNERLKLKKDGDKWLLGDDGVIDQWQGFAIALLWHKHPDAFASAVAKVIQRADVFAISPTLRVLAPQRPHPRERCVASGPIADALVDRIKSRMTKGMAEMALFEALRCLDPNRLVGESWDRYWGNWLPEAKVAFANEVAQSNLEEPGSIDRAIALLTALIGEGSYAVRRAAYRAMAKISPEALDHYCREWMAGSADGRRRAAEGAGWSETEGNYRLKTSGLARLLVDPERSVREAANRAVCERRNRSWADGYLEHVLAVRNCGNDEVLKAYRYGQALARVGDDNHKRRLEVHLATTDLPLHVRHWLRRLIKGIEKHWRDVTAKWPEPWFSWGGTVEELEGCLVFDNSPPINAHFSLWRKGQSSPSDRYSWGGVVQSSAIGFQHAFAASHDVTLRIQGRKDAMAILSQFTAKSGEPHYSVVFLQGNGAYPEEQSNPVPST